MKTSRAKQRFKFTILWIVALTFIGRSQEINGYRTVNVTFNTNSPSQLEINRGRLVWIDKDLNTSSLNLEFYSSAEIVKLDSGRQGILAAIDGDHVVWNTSAGQLRVFNIRNWSTTLIGSSYAPGVAQPVSVANGFAAYARNISPTGTEIILRNLVGGTETTLQAKTWNTVPSLHHGQVAWVGGQLEAATTSTDIFFFNGTSVANISNAGGSRCDSPILRDANVIWLEKSLSFTRVRTFNGDSTVTLAQVPQGPSKIVGYDVSGGIAIAGVTDTVRSISFIAIFNSSTGRITSIGDSNSISSPHIDNQEIVWASGKGPSKVMKIYDVRSGVTQVLGATDNPVLDDEEVAWTLGDAVEMRVPVTYEILTSNLNNGWTQTRFKEIDNGKIIWGNYDQSVNARVFYSNGTSTSRRTDSLIYKDFFMANEGYAIWREDFNKLWLFNGSGQPVKIVDSLQCENMYVAGGSIGFHGFRLNSGNNIQQAWMYRISPPSLLQLTKETSTSVANGITLVNGNTACWHRDDGVIPMLMYYNGSTTARLSDSTIGDKFSYRGNIIVWDERRNGLQQIKMYNTTAGTTLQVTNGNVSAFSPITDGSRIVWFEGSPTNSSMCYYDILSGEKTKVTHLVAPNFRWLWLSNGRIAWTQDNEVHVFDGSVITRLTNSGGFRSNVEPYVDNETVLWKQDSPIQSFPQYGDIYRGKLQAHVGFDASHIQGQVPLSVSFNNRSWEGVRSYLWDFGDGATSTEANPAHVYSAVGTYSVTLTVAGLSGNASEKKLNLVRALSTTGVQVISSSTPMQFSLHQNYPNPFNPETKILFDLAVTSHVIIRVFDMLGRETRTLVNESLNAGTHVIAFDGTALSSGVYFCRLFAEGKDSKSTYSSNIKMVLLR
jgi:PKD repeat protein